MSGPRMMPGQEPYTADEYRRLTELVADAAAGDPGEAAERCRAYFRGRGLLIIRPGRRCELGAGHAGAHTCARNGLGTPFVFRWGRA